MRGIGRTISRLSAARAVLAGAAILAGAALRPAHGTAASGGASSEDLAMAVPRVHPPSGSSGVGLPQPLPPSEAARVRRIFALQRQGAIPAAIAETARLGDTSLLGHILADRLLAHPARAAAPALSDWLGRYADLPDACAIYALLLKKLPAGARLPAAPPAASLAPAGRGAPDVVSTAARAARDALTRGRDQTALRLGRAAFALSHGRDGQAAYVAGLASWRRGGYADSASLFEGASVAEGGGAGLRASAALWAARAHLRLGDTPAWHAWMLRAAAEPHTLHGMLARTALGLAPAVSPSSPILAEADVEAVADTPQGHRAFALLQVGETARAEAELRRLWPAAQADLPLSRALFLVAGAAGLGDLVADLSGIVDATEADLPAPQLRPRGGFKLDRALVYAVAHVESNFDRAAVSGAGAHGMMQLMPQTASALGPSVSSAALDDSGQNLRLGQAYLAYLAQPAIAGDDLLRVLASYNAGPSAVQRWAMPSDTDPLMFLEIIPSDETRHFVPRILANLWGYAARFSLHAPSLEAMAAGVWPAFTPELGAVPCSRFQQAVVRLH